LPTNFHVNNLSSFGLQLVYELVEQLDGEITVTHDKGTTFTIMLEDPEVNLKRYP